MGNKTCVGCKFLYSEGDGYSNYTWLSDEVRCALDKNLKLPAERPSDWKRDTASDNWPKTRDMRCESYSPGIYVELDVDGLDGPADYTDDKEQIEAICKDTGRSPYGMGGKVE